MLLYALKTRDEGHLLLSGGDGGCGTGGPEELDSHHREEAVLRFSVQSLGPVSGKNSKTLQVTLDQVVETSFQPPWRCSGWKKTPLTCHPAALP